MFKTNTSSNISANIKTEENEGKWKTLITKSTCTYSTCKNKPVKIHTNHQSKCIKELR